MTTFDDREDSFEKKFAHDEELRFKAMARRNKLFGQWVAEQLGRSGSEADAYARSVVMADFKETGTRTSCTRSAPIWRQRAIASARRSFAAGWRPPRPGGRGGPGRPLTP